MHRLRCSGIFCIRMRQIFSTRANFGYRHVSRESSALSCHHVPSLLQDGKSALDLAGNRENYTIVDMLLNAREEWSSAQVVIGQSALCEGSNINGDNKVI